MKLNLQFFGGRGGSSSGKGAGGGGSAGGASKDGTLTKSTPKEIETTFHVGHRYNMTRGYYNDDVLQAKTDGAGHLTFEYADWEHSPPSAKTNKTHSAKTTITHGAINGRLYGVDLSKATSVSGQTYDLRTTIKSAGFRWNAKEKRWEK